MEYEVKKGDGWYRIAKNLGVDVNDLLKANNATLETVLHPGQRLNLQKEQKQELPINKWNVFNDWANERVLLTTNLIQQARQANTEKEAEIQRKASQGTKGLVLRQAKADTIRLQQALLKEGYNLGKWGADGSWGKATDAAIAQAEKDGWTVDNYQLVKKPQPKVTQTPQVFGAAGPEYAVMAQALMFKKDSSKDTLGNGIKSSIPYRDIHQKAQAFKDGFKNVSLEVKNRNYGKAAFSALGTLLDVTTTPITSLGLKVAPSYALPFKDIPITAYNRLGRHIFDDENYTAIEGRTYTNEDYSEGVNKVAKELMTSGKPVDYTTISEVVKRDVNPNLDYGDPALLKHPFNPTAAYAWTIGGQSVQTNSDGSVLSGGSNGIGDVYDNAPNKNEHYLKSLTTKPSIPRYMRAIGGMFTAHDGEPAKGKLKTLLKYR